MQMDFVPGFAVALVAAIAVGTIAFAVIGRMFPELSSREKERSRAAAQGEGGLQDKLVEVSNRLSRFLPAKAEDAIEYKDKIAQAGLKMAPETWHGIQLLSCAVVGILLGVLFLSAEGLDLAFKVLFVVAGFVFGWFMPGIFLWAKTNERREKIEKELPNTLELLTLSVRAGYPLTHGIKLVGQTETGELAKEFRTVDADVNLLGMDISLALERMQARCASDLVAGFCAAVIQAQRQGTSIARILDSQAKLARDTQYTRTMRKISTLSSKMSFIIIFAFLPPLFAILVVPGLVNTVSNLSGVF